MSVSIPATASRSASPVDVDMTDAPPLCFDNDFDFDMEDAPCLTSFDTDIVMTLLTYFWSFATDARLARLVSVGSAATATGSGVRLRKE